MRWPSEQQAPRRVGGRIGRRALLLGSVGVGGLALAGCGIHLEDDAPNVPLVPRRTPIGAETELLALLRNSRELAAACGRWTTGPQVALAESLAAAHRQQADVLATLLTDAHVPAALLAQATRTIASTPTTPAAAAPVTTADVADLERVPLADARRLAAAPAALRATVASILAQRFAAASVTGGVTPTIGPTGMTGAPTTTTTAGTATATASPPTPSTTTTGTLTPRPQAADWPAADLTGLLAATRSAVYGFEVVAAQGDAAVRALGLRTLATLAAIQAAQLAGLTAPPPAAIGYPLPFPVTTPASARRLAGALATGLRAAYGSHLAAAALGGPFLDVVGWLGQAEVDVHDWGGALVPFPGMTTP